jgi:hypothetical protein
MVGQVAKPETPLLAAELSLHGIAVLIEGFEIAEYAHDLLASNAKRIDAFRALGKLMN